MNVIAINGSPRKDSNCGIALSIMADELKKDDINTEIIQIGTEHIHGCVACGYCGKSQNHHCIYTSDMLNEVADKARKADGLILASPTYYAGISGSMKSFLDRLFYTGTSYFNYKVGTSIAIARRAGGVDVIHQLNNYFLLAKMIIPPSQYWTVVYGNKSTEILQDTEGIQTIQKNAQSMGWLLKIIQSTQESIPHPHKTHREWTNFIR